MDNKALFGEIWFEHFLKAFKVGPEFPRGEPPTTPNTHLALKP